MITMSRRKDNNIIFRVESTTKKKFEQKCPVYAKRSKILRELLRLYLEGEIKISKVTETL
jgi:hypothetical protein